MRIKTTNITRTRKKVRGDDRFVHQTRSFSTNQGLCLTKCWICRFSFNGWKLSRPPTPSSKFCWRGLWQKFPVLQSIRMLQRSTRPWIVQNERSTRGLCAVLVESSTSWRLGWEIDIQRLIRKAKRRVHHSDLNTPASKPLLVLFLYITDKGLG